MSATIVGMNDTDGDAAESYRSARAGMGESAGLAVTPVASTILDRALHTRAVARAPIRLYRAGLGFVFGSRMLMLEHVGRVSGARRYVVLEVIGHPARGVYLVPSGFGESAQWFRNVMAHPKVRVSVAGRRNVQATARRLSAFEADDTLRGYIDRHPRAWAALRGVVANALEGQLDPPGTTLPIVELRMT